MLSNKDSMAKSYRELIVWQKAMELALSIYKLTSDFPHQEQYGLISQIRRSAVSVPSNIAEGCGRLKTGEYAHFLGIARGSLFELQTQLELARRLGFGDQTLIQTADDISQEVAKMIHAVLESLKRDRTA
jgi:four helix bundle protein